MPRAYFFTDASTSATRPPFPITRRCQRGRWSSHVLTQTLELLNIIAQTPQFRIASVE
jgi:hypothetical protein